MTPRPCAGSCDSRGFTSARAIEGRTLGGHCMKTFLKTATALATIGFIATAGQTKAEAAELTLCWAAWDPANALVELSKDFEAQTGTTMKFEFVPWPNFADRMLNELNSGGKLCDLMIG